MNNQAAMEVFSHEGKDLEVIQFEGEPLFNARSVAKMIGVTDGAAREAIRHMEESYDYRLLTNAIIQSNSDVSNSDIRKLNNRGETFLTESGVYEIIFKSQKEEAKRFKRWITREVLPAIRKTGTYSIQPQIPQTLPEALRLAADLAENNERLQIAAKEAAPKIESFDRYMDASGSMSVNLAGKILGIGQNKLFKILRENKVLMNYPSTKKRKNPKRDLHNQPYQKYVDRGWFITKPGTYNRNDAARPIGHSETTRITTKGLDEISKLMVKLPGQKDLFN